MITKTLKIIRKFVVLDKAFTNDWGHTYEVGERFRYGKGAHRNCELTNEGLALKCITLIPNGHFHLEEERETITTSSSVEIVRV